jgi:5-methylcytosine-specific restriction endonuclease McrA
VSRSVDEWVGATDDTAIPDRVRLRVFLRFHGVCHCCERKITTGETWVCDHMQALINGGENRENNLAPLCDWCDKRVKTPADVAEKSRTYRRRAKHLGIKPRKARPMPGTKASGWKRKMNGTLERRT